MREIDAHYPGGDPGGEVLRVVGSEDQWVSTPSWTPLRIEGTGNVYTVVYSAIYPDKTRWFVTSIIELRDQLVWRAMTFFAEAFEPPEWRRLWVEHMEPK